jgi:hypothetical protein
MALPSITYGTLSQYFQQAALGRIRGGVSATQIATALTGMLSTGIASANPLNQTLGEKLAAVRAGAGQGYGYRGPAFVSASRGWYA